MTLAQVLDQLGDRGSLAHYVTPGHVVEPVRFDRTIVPGRRASPTHRPALPARSVSFASVLRLVIAGSYRLALTMGRVDAEGLDHHPGVHGSAFADDLVDCRD